MELFYHPQSRYSQKVLLAMYEKQAQFQPRVTDLRHPLERRAFAQIYPLGKLPLLKCADGSLLAESSIIIEYLDSELTSGTRLIPSQPERALKVRMWDRIIDIDINNQLLLLEQQLGMNKAQRNELTLAQLRNTLMLIFTALDNELAANYWLVGDGFTLADCALLPCLAPAFELLSLLDLEHLCRYRERARLRGSWELVAKEAAGCVCESSSLKLSP